jgi:hypothetical protein
MMSERYHSSSKKIESYCVDCEMEQRYHTQLELSTGVRKETVRKISVKVWFMLIAGGILLFLLPVHFMVKVLLFFFLFLYVLKVILDPFLSQASPTRKPDWDDIRAKALNQSSIQANEVENVKRQWKKGFLQERKNKFWTEEDWQQYLKQHYKKE